MLWNGQFIVMTKVSSVILRNTGKLNFTSENISHFLLVIPVKCDEICNHNLLLFCGGGIVD